MISKLRQGSLLMLLGLVCIITIPLEGEGTFAQDERFGIEAIDWSPDGSKLAIGYVSGELEIIDTATGQIIFSDNSRKFISSLDWSPTCQQLAIGQQNELDESASQVIDPINGEILRQHNSHEWIISSVAWSPDGTLLADALQKDAGQNATWEMRIWDITTIPSTAVAHYEIPTHTIAWSPDGTRIAVTNLYGVQTRIIESETGEVIINLADFDASSAVWSPDGNLIASGTYESKIYVWDANTGQEILSFPYESIPTAITWSPDGTRIANGSFTHGVDVWDITTGQHLRNYTAQRGVWAVAWSPDGGQIAYGDNNTLRIVPAPPLQSNRPDERDLSR